MADGENGEMAGVVPKKNKISGEESGHPLPLKIAGES